MQEQWVSSTTSALLVIKDKGMAVAVIDILTKGAGECYGAGEVAGGVQAKCTVLRVHIFKSLESSGQYSIRLYSLYMVSYLDSNI